MLLEGGADVNMQKEVREGEMGCVCVVRVCCVLCSFCSLTGSFVEW